MTTIKQNLWIGAIVFSLVMIAFGGFFVAKGVSAKALITEQLTEEKITTSNDAELFGVPGGLPVADARTAQAQADVIKYHSIENWGLFSEMERSDPNRANYITGLTLRNSLSLAVMGYGIADFAMGVGAVLILVGIGGIALVAPSLYWVRSHETAHVKGRVPQAAGAVAGK